MSTRRTEIVQAALEVAQQRGLAAMSMRAVADHLDSSVMGLYRHVPTKEVLLDELVGRLLAEVELPDPTHPWRQRLEHLAEQVYALAWRYPTVVPLLTTRAYTAPAAVRVVAATSAVLADAGVPGTQIPRLERMVSVFLLGYATAAANGAFWSDPGATTPPPTGDGTTTGASAPSAAPLGQCRHVPSPAPTARTLTEQWRTELADDVADLAHLVQRWSSPAPPAAGSGPGDAGGVAMRLGPGEPAAGPWRVEPVAVLVDLLLRAAGEPPSRPRVVAVDGRSGSGKTTVAQLVAARVPGSVVVHTDDVAWHHSFFDWADLLVDGVLAPVHRGLGVAHRPPAWQERGRAGAVEVPAGCPLVLVEGCGAARRELAPWLDAVAWVQSDVVEAERRGVARDGGDEAAAAFWREWAAQEDPFVADQRPWERASVVVAGTAVLEHDRASQVVLAPPPHQR